VEETLMEAPYYYIIDGSAWGPYTTVEEAKGDIEDWQLHRHQVFIVQAVEISDTKVTYDTEWVKRGG
jgi:hypothetical protein